MSRLVCAALVVIASGLSLAASSASVNPFASGFWPNPPWCPTCFVASHTDSHVPGVTPLHQDGLLWGWASLCANGEVPNMLTAVANTPSWQVPIDIGYVQRLPRPDVDAHLQANGCASNPEAGFVAWFYGWPPDTRSVTVIIHRQGIVAWHNFPVFMEEP